MFEEALQASIVRVDVGRTPYQVRGRLWEGGGELSQIDGFDLEQSDDEGGQTGDASPVQASGRLEQVGEFGRVIHGVISWEAVVVDRLGRPSTLGGYTLSFNYLITFVVYSGNRQGKRCGGASTRALYFPRQESRWECSVRRLPTVPS